MEHLHVQTKNLSIPLQCQFFSNEHVFEDLLDQSAGDGDEETNLMP